MSAYAHGGASGGSAYASSKSGTSTTQPKKSGGGGGGFLGGVGSAISHAAGDAIDTGYNAGSGVVQSGYLLGKDIVAPSNSGDSFSKQWGDLFHGHLGRVFSHKNLAGDSFGRDLGAIGTSYKETAEHPLRHPFDTALNLLPVVGVGGRLALGAKAARAAEEGKVAAAVRAASSHPEQTLGERTIRVREGEVASPSGYSRAAGSAFIQKAVDRGFEKLADKGIGRFAEKRAGKWTDRTLRVQEAKAHSIGTQLAKMGEKLSAGELAALRMVAEQTPVDERIAAQTLRAKRAASPAETARHQERIEANRAAKMFLDADSAGRPIFRASATKLKRIYGLMEEAASSREEILQQLGLMDKQSLHAAKVKTARVALGTSFRHIDEVVPKSRPAAEAKLARLEKDQAGDVERLGNAWFGGEKAVGAEAATRVSDQIGKLADTHPDEPLVKAWDQRAATIKSLRDAIHPTDAGVDENAIHIGNPVKRTRITGRPKVSSRSTFGHTPKSDSLKTSTGASVERALERQDVPAIVAERHAEAIRLDMIRQRVDRVKDIGTAEPRTFRSTKNPDVFVWTDKTVSQERVPKIVRQYLDDPEAIATRSEGEQRSIIKDARSAFVNDEWAATEASRAEFSALAKEGKGVFVPRKALGRATDPDYPLPDSIRGPMDAINNAQKAAFIYLKPSYPLTQALGNTAMNLIQQGFAFPKNITHAARLSHRLGPEWSAVIDDIMGEGAVPQAAFTGQGAVSHATQRFATFLSRPVDVPARRSAFLHEAYKLGYKSPDQIIELLEDDAKVKDLVKVAQRGKEAIVDYQDLTPFERTYIRRIFFIYPWSKGAVKYAGTFMRDHPVQAAALGMIAANQTDRQNETVGPMPSYLRGQADVGGELVNLNSISPFSTAAQVADTLGSVLARPGHPKGVDLLAPFPSLVVQGLTRENGVGQPLPNGIGPSLRAMFVEPTPAAAALRSLTANQNGTVGNLTRDIAGSRSSSQTFPDNQDALYRFFLGGLYPRRYSKPAVNKNAAREHANR